MNFINVSLVEKESILLAVTDGVELPVPPEKKVYLQHIINSEVIMGIRPEHLDEKTFADTSAYKASISATVDVIETLGAEVQLIVSTGDHSIVARVDARTITKRRENINLALNIDHLHFFDKFFFLFVPVRSFAQGFKTGDFYE